MSGGLPEEKPWASCCPRSEATITLTLLPVCLLQAAAALFTANVSAGPELPIRAVMVTALLRVGEPRAAPTATASAQTVTTTSATRQRAIRFFRCAFTKDLPPWRTRKTSEPWAQWPERLRSADSSGYLLPSDPATAAGSRCRSGPPRRKRDLRGSAFILWAASVRAPCPSCQGIFPLTGTAVASDC